MMNTLLLALVLAAEPPEAVTGSVYDDTNANGRRDPGERGVPGVVVSDGTVVGASASDGGYRLEGARGRLVFVVLPSDRRAVGSWYRPRAESVDLPLAPHPAGAEWRFAHLSDTHVHSGKLERIRRALDLARARQVDFAVVSGDLVKDALRVDEAAARGLYTLYAEETAKARFRYYGFLDADQLAWIRAELAFVPAGTSVVTVCHIPLRSGALSTEFQAEGPARTLLTVNGGTSFRPHVVRNTKALAEVLQAYRWTLALQGHSHQAERLRIWDGGMTRYHTAPAVDRQAWAPWPSGIVVYTVRGDAIDDGELVLIDER